jgi:hypothetical protein
MNNEPVAWMLETKRGNISCFVKPSDEFNWIPLYTHPAKTLTDEEMRKVINENVENVTVAEMVMFLTVCKAILRKAQEK